MEREPAPPDGPVARRDAAPELPGSADLPVARLAAEGSAARTSEAASTPASETPSKAPSSPEKGGDRTEKSSEKSAEKASEKAEPAPEPEAPQPLPIPIARLVPKLKKSAKLFEEGKKYIPNSTSSLIRVASYDPCPPFIAKGKGSRIWDEDGNEYLDFNLAYGCLINGHAHPEMVKALNHQAELGFHFASPTELEIEVAKTFMKLVPNNERIAFCSNGSDATMNAIRIA
ncbi:MAG: aminotransferase class III-fold pyridoxal phosphate-dependent enzyme, partial [Thermoplasmata archaeon]|nr:aminotransferase class III-fold pyridoxal phosphate-dependent enzyme [Thermoplasmata archaeon]